jgi:uncharacterized membrane protein
MTPSAPMTSARLEAFSDGVIAIIVTIMVLELKVPHEASLGGLAAQWPVFVSYALSFLLVAEYWVNHHMLFHMVRRVSNRILWSNLFMLFCISMIPFFTAFMGENRLGPFPVAAYCLWTMICSLSFINLLSAIFPHFEDGPDTRLFRRAALFKALTAACIYAVAACAAPAAPAAALLLNVVVAMMYFLPHAWLGQKEK